MHDRLVANDCALVPLGLLTDEHVDAAAVRLWMVLALEGHGIPDRYALGAHLRTSPDNIGRQLDQLVRAGWAVKRGEVYAMTLISGTTT